MADSHRTLWPEFGDELLLRGALLEGDEAVPAWQQWHAGADYGNLDFTQQRVLPLLHENLRRLGVSHPVLDHYRAVSRRFWAQNQMLYRRAAVELKSLSELNIRALVLKGVPLSLGYYSRPGLRPMSDVDILVDPSNVSAASGYFLNNGWICVDEFIDSLDNLDEIIEVRHAFNLRGPDAQELDLHWNVFPTCFVDLQTLWNSAETFDLCGFEASTLCATDHLLHACSQAAGWNVVRPIRWIADALTVIRASSIDWDRLTANATRFDLAEPVHDALIVLRELLGLAIPEATLSKLQSIPTCFASRIDYRLSARKPIPIVGRPLQRYFRYLRTARPRGLSFSKYMKQFWGVPSFFRLVKLGLKRVCLNATGRMGG
jgi:hypothetical protein